MDNERAEDYYQDLASEINSLHINNLILGLYRDKSLEDAIIDFQQLLIKTALANGALIHFALSDRCRVQGNYQAAWFDSECQEAKHKWKQAMEGWKNSEIDRCKLENMLSHVGVEHQTEWI